MDTEVRPSDEDLIEADEIDENFRPKPGHTVVGVEIDGEVVLLDRESLSTHHLDRVGSVIWSCFDGVGTLGEICRDLSDAFGVALETVTADVMELTRVLGKRGLLEGVAVEIPEPVIAGIKSLEMGTRFPAFSLPNIEGQQVSLEDLNGRRRLLVNWSPSCGFCSRIAPDLAKFEQGLTRHGVDLVFLANGDKESNRKLLKEAGLDSLLLLQDESPVSVFEGVGTPAAYLIDEKGEVASALFLGADRVPELASSLAKKSYSKRPKKR